MKPPAFDDRQEKAAERSKAARQNGRCGGQERASRYERVILSEWASWGGKAVLERYGREYFKGLRKRRKNYPKYSESPVIRPNLRKIASQENGRRGGMRRAEFYSPEHLREWARLGGIATRTRHGNEFFREIRKLRKYYLKGYVTQKTKEKMRQMMVEMYRAESNPLARRAMQLYLQSQNGGSD
jgi:hypothetical protein